MSGPRVLVVTSAAASPVAVVPVLAAMDAAGLTVRAIDAGRVGAPADGTLERVMRAIVGEVAERRLLREITANPPDVVVSFDPSTTTALTVARDEAKRPAPVVAVVGELDPDSEWASCGADRFLVVDDEAAVTLSDHGVEGDRIIPVGAMCSRGFADAAAQSRASLRSRFKIASDRPVVVVHVDGLGYETCGQLALQLSLTGVDATYLFDAGEDREAATALRRQVPVLELRAKLFGRTADAPLLWRCADIAVARPRAHAVAQALMVGARFVSFLPESKADKRAASALEARGLGASAANALLVSSALESLIKRGEARSGRTGTDGAANVADIAWVVGKARREVLEERRSQQAQDTRERVRTATEAAQAAARASAVAGDLEDLGGGGGGGFSADVADVPRAEDVERLRAEVAERVKQVSKTVLEARESAESWDKRRQKANAAKDATKEREAERNADRERARMHAALAELSELQSELKGLENAAAAAAAAPPPRAPASDAPRPPRGPAKKSIDEMLADMKRQQGGGTSVHAGGGRKTKKRRKKPTADPLDDELAALKRKMAANKKRGK